MTYSCIKCKETYESDDVEAYYCPVCLEEKKRIAQEIDAKIQTRPKKPTVSALQEYDNAMKVHGFVQVKF